MDCDKALPGPRYRGFRGVQLDLDEARAGGAATAAGRGGFLRNADQVTAAQDAASKSAYPRIGKSIGAKGLRQPYAS